MYSYVIITIIKIQNSSFIPKNKYFHASLKKQKKKKKRNSLPYPGSHNCFLFQLFCWVFFSDYTQMELQCTDIGISMYCSSWETLKHFFYLFCLFLFILYVFHITYLDPIHFPVLSHLFSAPVQPSPPPKKRTKFKRKKGEINNLIMEAAV